MASKFGVVPTLAILDKDITNAELRVLALLCSYADKNGECFPSQQTMAEQLNVRRDDLNKRLRLIEQKGWVTSSRRFRQDGSERAKLYCVMHDFGGEGSETHRGEGSSTHGEEGSETHTEHTTIKQTTNQQIYTADIDVTVDKTENNLPADTTHEWDLEAFEIWWSAFPNQFQKKKAKQAYMVAMRKTDCATLLRGAEEYARQNKTTSTEYIKRPENWLKSEMWDDYQPQPKAKYLWDGNVVEVTPDVAAQFNMTKIKG
jgi:hypothetical protein|tara:strand:- start:1606 stop:2382 length:777 start_codon:yes stop_codon:yes gene_type:complete